MKRMVHFLAASCIFTVGLSAKGDFLDQDGLLRNNAGSIHYVQHSELSQACLMGTHVASIREMALFGQSHGAAGILDASQPTMDGDKYVHETNNTNDKFDYRATGYQRPAGDLGSLIVWTTAEEDVNMDPMNPDGGTAFYWVFNIKDGNFYTNEGTNAVICTPGQKQ
jgi:hypothetical protein